ncbi:MULTISPECIES: GT99 family glycosyltransferase N-terminal domain-containing protein [unclassified Caballeronia]|uniref:GT99 family glycosyltransferase N-terminal domain-containing protein n=1 Tax=unclassified Caballeronia TaxID=2646786 RepID=UPI0020282614|nr:MULTISPECIES: hypothetical protein [unclassified Caballeronia]MDR5764606.1 hypothetical protein [Caballeronia sp. LZ028]
MTHFVLFVPLVAPVEGTAHYYWVILKWLHAFRAKQSTILLPRYYLNIESDLSRWELSDWSKQFHEYNVGNLDSERVRLVCYEDGLTDWSLDKAPLDRFISYVTRDSSELHRYFADAFSRLKALHQEVVAVTWLNCPSMRRAAQESGCALVFNEIGPLRKPYYAQCAYWDTSGVNGDTEVGIRWQREKAAFRDWVGDRGDAAISETLESVLISDAAREMYRSSEDSHTIGVALQVETDSNALAFSKGWNNLSLLEFASRSTSEHTPLVRYHPNGKALYPGKVDLGSSPLKFLGAIQELWTINSSLGIEAVLWRKKVRFFGSTPIQTFFDESGESSRLFRIWFFLNYLIPYSLLFSSEYYLWRLSNPSVADIAEKHFVSFQNQRRGERLVDKKPVPETSGRTLEVDAPNKLLDELFNLRRQCAEQNTRISQLQTFILDRDRWISDRDGWIKERDQWIAERDARIRVLETCGIEHNASSERPDGRSAAEELALNDRNVALDRLSAEAEVLRLELAESKEAREIAKQEHERLREEFANINAQKATEVALREKAESDAVMLSSRLAALELRHDRLLHAARIVASYLQSRLVTTRWRTRHLVAMLKLCD